MLSVRTHRAQKIRVSFSADGVTSDFKQPDMGSPSEDS